MSAPRHLWSGDWQSESASHAEDLAARRGRNEPPVEPEAVVRPAHESPLRRAIAMLRERLRRLWAVRPQPRRVRVALLVAFITLLVAGVAYALASNSSTTKSPAPATASGAGPAWLGVELTNAGVGGATVSSVVRGSPAAKAGIRPGDVITALDTQPIVAPAILIAALSGLQPGDPVDIQVQRGASQYTAHVVLGSPPAGGP
jgi:membrane-associated protease RseP (regulator of RpoE activity)